MLFTLHSSFFIFHSPFSILHSSSSILYSSMIFLSPPTILVFLLLVFFFFFCSSSVTFLSFFSVFRFVLFSWFYNAAISSLLFLGPSCIILHPFPLFSSFVFFVLCASSYVLSLFFDWCRESLPKKGDWYEDFKTCTKKEMTNVVCSLMNFALTSSTYIHRLVVLAWR